MKKNILLLLVCLLCSVSVYALDSDRVKVYNSSQAKNISGEIKYVDIVIDYSGSMYYWIEEAKRAVRTITERLPRDIHIGVRTFGEKVVETKHTTLHQVGSGKIVMRVNKTKSSGGCSATTQVLPIVKNSSDAIVAGMNMMQIGGSTPITLGLRQSVQVDFASIGQNNMKKIILVTDGEETCGGDPCRFIRNLVKTRKDYVVDVVCTGSDCSSLKCLSDATNGRFFYIRDTRSFENVLQDSITNQQTEQTRSQQYQTVPQQNQQNSSSYGYIYVE